MKSFNGHTSIRVVAADGTVSVAGWRRGKVMRLRRTGRWIYAQPGGRFTETSWRSQEEAVDALIEATGGLERRPQ